MRPVVVPFGKVFGDTSELRVIQFLLPMSDYEFNISDLARGSGVSRQALNSVVRKLLKWRVLRIVSKHGNANYYALNKESGFLAAFEDLNNCIIEQMLGEETLTRIATYSLEHQIKIHQIEELAHSHTKRWDSVSPGESWSELNLEDCLKTTHLDKAQDVKTQVYSGGIYAAA